MTLKEALEKTIELHQMVIDGKYRGYEEARKSENYAICPLCDYAEYMYMDIDFGSCPCYYCPYTLFTGTECTSSMNKNRTTGSYNYQNSVGSLIRLRTWLSQVERWGLE